MPETNITSAVVTDLTNTMVDYSVPAGKTDGTTDQKETRIRNNE